MEFTSLSISVCLSDSVSVFLCLCPLLTHSLTPSHSFSPPLFPPPFSPPFLCIPYPVSSQASLFVKSGQHILPSAQQYTGFASWRRQQHHHHTDGSWEGVHFSAASQSPLWSLLQAQLPSIATKSAEEQSTLSCTKGQLHRKHFPGNFLFLLPSLRQMSENIFGTPIYLWVRFLKVGVLIAIIYCSFGTFVQQSLRTKDCFHLVKKLVIN